MKYMKLGNQPDTFYTEEATRTLISDLPTDLAISINNTTYLLHKHALLPKCELLVANSAKDVVSMQLHDIPGGEDSFELCAKFCYGIAIHLSARNIVSTFCAAKFLQMADDQNNSSSSNLVQKLDLFFKSCILEGWKDSIVALQSTAKLPKWSDRFGLVRSCMDSILDKILTPPSKVRWSYTYTRPCSEQKKNHRSVPRDWWTEDLSDLDIDLFRSIITAAVKSTATNPLISSQLIGEALHVYFSRWLPTNQNHVAESSNKSNNETLEKRKIVEVISGLIPSEKGAVSVRFLMRLLSIANSLRVSSTTKADLVRKAGSELESTAVDDLLMLSANHDNIDTVRRVVESFLSQISRKNRSTSSSSVNQNTSLRKIGKMIDSYLQVIARDSRTTVSKFLSLASCLPDIARQDHDHLYKAINIYLKEHPKVRKEEKKRICRILDCTKLSAQVCSHAVRNERLPLRTVVQLLFFHGLDNINVPSQLEEKELEDEIRKLKPPKTHELGSISHDGYDQSKQNVIIRDQS